MLDAYLRVVKDRLLAPVSRAIGARVSPTAITCAALVVGLFSAGAVLAGRPRTAAVLWLVNRTLDGLDGAHARVQGRGSAFGAYLDIVLDFVVYAAIPLAIALASQRYDVAIAGMALVAAFYVNAASWMYLAALLEQRREGASARGEQTTVTMPAGLVAGSETVVFYALFLWFPSWVVPLFATMTALVLVTVVLRMRWAARHLAIN